MSLIKKLGVTVGILLVSFGNRQYVPVTGPKSRSPSSIKIPTKRTSGGHHVYHALNNAITKNLLWI